MTLGFKRRFGLFVWLGLKTHTIRAPRKGSRPLKVGDTLNCFVDTRQATMSRLGDWECTKIVPIRIFDDVGAGVTNRLGIEIDGVNLSEDERELFCRADGFRPTKKLGALDVFECYWLNQATGDRALPFAGELVHWRFTEDTGAPLPEIYQVECTNCSNLQNPRPSPLTCDWCNSPVPGPDEVTERFIVSP